MCTVCDESAALKTDSEWTLQGGERGCSTAPSCRRANDDASTCDWLTNTNNLAECCLVNSTLEECPGVSLGLDFLKKKKNKSNKYYYSVELINICVTLTSYICKYIT